MGAAKKEPFWGVEGLGFFGIGFRGLGFMGLEFRVWGL